MREVLATITTKGQVTIPVEIRQILGVGPHDKVAFVVDDRDAVRVRRTGSVVERTAGALKSHERPLTAKQLREAAEEAIAEEAVERMRG